MPIIEFRHKGDFKNTERFFDRVRKKHYLSIIEKYGQIGVDALREATPKDTGVTADSWSYLVEATDASVTLTWINSNTSKNISIVYLLMHGHGTQNGGYVVGYDFVTPVMEPIIKTIADKCWKEVTG